MKLPKKSCIPTHSIHQLVDGHKTKCTQFIDFPCSFLAKSSQRQIHIFVPKNTCFFMFFLNIQIQNIYINLHHPPPS